MKRRPPTPPDVAQFLRHEAYFGCCKCGSPIVQYHHIVPWHVEEHYRTQDMMALCPYCHDMVTKGAISGATQRRLKADPVNRRRGFVKGLLYAEGRYPAVAFGENVLMNNGPLVMLGDEVALGAKVSTEGCILLDLVLRDRRGNLLIRVRESEWVAGDRTLWDLEFSHNYLRIREKKNRVLLCLDARETPIALQATFWYMKSSLKVRAGKMLVALGGKPMSFQNCLLPGQFVQFVPEGVKIDIDPRLKRPPTFLTYFGKDDLEPAMRWIDEAT